MKIFITIIATLCALFACGCSATAYDEPATTSEPIAVFEQPQPSPAKLQKANAKQTINASPQAQSATHTTATGAVVSDKAAADIKAIKDRLKAAERAANEKAANKKP